MPKRKDPSVEEVVAGVEIYKQPNTKNLFYRRYDANAQVYIRRSTGCDNREDAKKWVMSNLEVIFQAKQEQQGGGNYSLRRLLAKHIDFVQRRESAGEISAASFVHYEKLNRHWIQWLPVNGYKKVSDIKRASLQEYAINRRNKDGYATNSVNQEVMYFRMFWGWLQETEVLSRPITIAKLKVAIENRTEGEAFQPGDLKKIHVALKQWASAKPKVGMNNISRDSYNSQLFPLFIQLLEEGGFRQHEVLDRQWKHIKIGETLSDRKRIINTVIVPHHAKRGYRQHIFRGTSLLEIRRLHKKMCVDPTDDDYIFRNKQTNTVIDRSTFSRYWTTVRDSVHLDYPLHVFRANRISELVLSGIEPALVARNLGLSLAQLTKTYLRYLPAAHYESLVQRDRKPDHELRQLINTSEE